MADALPAIDIVGFFVRLFGADVLSILLADRTTEHNVIWADDEYAELGEGYQPHDDIDVGKITGFSSGVIKTRTAKDAESQAGRTRRKAEVFTPSWLCNQMNNVFDDEWFGRSGVFNREVPLVAGAKVQHNAWGAGEIVEASSKRLVATFSVGEREFAVPSAFEQGYLKLIS